VTYIPPRVYDPIQVVLDLLRAGIDDVPVAADLVGHENGALRVVASLTGTTVQVRHRLDRVNFDFDAYGPTKNAAVLLAMRARAVLLESGPGSSFQNVGIADVEETLGPQDLTDGVSRESRFVFSVALYMYLRS
jgi:hypothetical protein